MDKRLPWSVPTSRATAWYSPPSWLIWIWRNFNWTANVCQSIYLMERYWFPRFVFLQKSQHPWNPHHCLQLTFLPLTKYFYEHFSLSVCCCIVDQSKLVLHSWTSSVSSHTMSSSSSSPIHMQSWLSTNTKTSASTSSTLLSWCMWWVSLHQYHLLLNRSCRNSFSRRMCLLVIWSTLWDILRNGEWTLARRERVLKYDPPAEEIRADFFDMSTLKSAHHCSICLYNIYETWWILDVLHGYLTNGFITISQKDNLN